MKKKTKRNIFCVIASFLCFFSVCLPNLGIHTNESNFKAAEATTGLNLRLVGNIEHDPSGWNNTNDKWVLTETSSGVYEIKKVYMIAYDNDSNFRIVKYGTWVKDYGYSQISTNQPGFTGASDNNIHITKTGYYDIKLYNGESNIDITYSDFTLVGNIQNNGDDWNTTPKNGEWVFESYDNSDWVRLLGVYMYTHSQSNFRIIYWDSEYYTVADFGTIGINGPGFTEAVDEYGNKNIHITQTGYYDLYLNPDDGQLNIHYNESITSQLEGQIWVFCSDGTGSTKITDLPSGDVSGFDFRFTYDGGSYTYKTMPSTKIMTVNQNKKYYATSWSFESGYQFSNYRLGYTDNTEQYNKAGSDSSNYKMINANPASGFKNYILFYFRRNHLSLTLNNQSATSSGTTTIYEEYAEGFYLTNDLTKKMTASANKITVPTKTGYIFGGYYTATNGDGTQVITSTGAINTSVSTKVVNTNSTLYAKWTAKTTTVTLNKQEGTGGTSNVTATYGSAMPDITVPTKEGYTFGGYYTETGGSGTQYYNASGKSSNNWNFEDSSKTLYAKWTISTYTITYDRNQGYGSTQVEQSKTHGINVNALVPGAGVLSAAAWNPSQYHYFKHWNTAYDDSDAVVEPNATIDSNADFTLYYIEAWYEYRYSINGGSPVYMTNDSAADGALRQFSPVSAQELPLHGILQFQVNRHDGNGWVNISVNYESGSNYNTTTGIQLATNDTIFLKLCDSEVYNVWVPGISDRTIKITHGGSETAYSMKGNGDDECVTVGYVYAQIGDLLEAEYMGGAYKVWFKGGTDGFANDGATWEETTGVYCSIAGAYTVYLQKGSGEWHDVWIVRDEEASAKHFAQLFNTNIGSVCTGIQSGTKGLSDLQSVWGASSTAGLYKDYLEYSSATKAYFTGATSTSDEEILNCIEKYNYAINKYGTSQLPNFMERNDAYKTAISTFSPFSIMNGESGDNISTIIIIIASSISLLSITALSLLMIKKKHEKAD